MKCNVFSELAEGFYALKAEREGKNIVGYTLSNATQGSIIHSATK